MSKTKIEIIDEIAGLYNSTNRSMKQFAKFDKEDYCAYNGINGRMCAFAHMCIDSSKLEETFSADHQLKKFGEVILKPEYRGHSVDFYLEVQRLHDYKENWSVSGLSSMGRIKVEEMKKKYSEPEPSVPASV